MRQPRYRILLGFLALVLLVRIALPFVLRTLIVSQADAALVGRIALADLDLSLIRGGVTLHGLEVHVDELPTQTPALLEAKRLWTQISWLALFTKTLELEEFELDGFVVRLDRLKDGFLLPRPVPGDTADEPESAEPLGWSLAANDVALRDGQISVRDYTVGAEPQRFDLTLKDLSATQLALRIDPTGQEPGRIAIQAQIGEGLVGLDTQVTQHPGGTGARSTITLANLPIDKVRVYLTMFGWSDLTGKLDALIEHRFEPGVAHEISGAASLSEVSVRVPALEGPALAWQKLSVTLESLDVSKQSAVVADVALVGARVAVDLKAKTPVPAIAAREGRDEAGAQEPTRESAKPAEPAKPWTWSVRRARLEDAEVELLGAVQPLVVGVDAELGSLSSEPGNRSPLELSLIEREGSLRVDGSLAISPLAFDGKLAIADLELSDLLSRVDAPGVDLLRKGKLRADLAIALAADLHVSGVLGLSGLEIADPEIADEFGVAWHDFEIGIRELSVPGLLGASDPSQARAIDVKLDRLRIVEPAFTITRTEQGILLPSFGASEAGPAEPEGPATEVQILVADVRIDRARARIRDRAVDPHFSTAIERLDLHARGVRWPGPRVDDLTLGMRGLQGARLDVHGSVIPGNSKLEAKLVELPLGQFNPYVTPTGYALADGSLSLDSTVKIGKDAYATATDVVIARLDVGGSKGEALFEQNFGIPLSVALSLLEDLDGNITLSVPVDADRGGVKVGLGSIVAQALRKALMGALASPLKLLGAVTADGKVQSLAPEPIVFTPGDGAPSAEAAGRIEQIATLLAGSPLVSLTLTGVVSGSDVRILRERVLLADLEATSGVRALAQLGEIGTRRAVRTYLSAKLSGADPAALEPEPNAWLESHVVEQKIDPAALATLANARAVAIRDTLTREHEIAAPRLELGAPSVEPSAQEPGVAIALRAARKPASR